MEKSTVIKGILGLLVVVALVGFLVYKKKVDANAVLPGVPAPVSENAPADHKAQAPTAAPADADAKYGNLTIPTEDQK